MLLGKQRHQLMNSDVVQFENCVSAEGVCLRRAQAVWLCQRQSLKMWVSRPLQSFGQAQAGHSGCTLSFSAQKRDTYGTMLPCQVCIRACYQHTESDIQLHCRSPIQLRCSSTSTRGHSQKHHKPRRRMHFSVDRLTHRNMPQLPTFL